MARKKLSIERFIVRDWTLRQGGGFYIVDTDAEGQMPVGPFMTEPEALVRADVMNGVRTQRQDGMIDQLRDLIPYANLHGMYDAADFLQSTVDRADKKAGEIHERHPLGGRRQDFDPAKSPYCHE